MVTLMRKTLPSLFVFCLILFTTKLLGADKLGKFSPFQSSAVAKYGTKGGWRAGISTGFNFYIGYQMDYQITRNFGKVNELRLGYGLGAYYTLNNNWEIGGAIRTGKFESLKSSNTQGILGSFNEVQVNFNKSLNDNILLDVARTSLNVQFGLGLINFQSQYVYFDPRTKLVTLVASSIGYGNSDIGRVRNENIKNLPDRITTLTANFGLSYGYRLSGNVVGYAEATYVQTFSNKFSGNLLISETNPPDGFLFTGVSLYVNLGKKVGSFGRNSCPRWF